MKDTVRIHLTDKEGWLLDSIFKGRGLFQIYPFFNLMKIMAEAIVEGEADGEIEEGSLWLLIDMLPASLMLGDTKGVDLLMNLYRLALELFRGKPIPDAFKNAFKEVEDADKNRTAGETRYKDTGEDFAIY